MAQQVRFNFPEECEKVCNDLVTKVQEICEVYQQMAVFFLRDDVALPEYEMLLWRRSDQLRLKTVQIISFINQRGGRVQFQDIPKPQQNEWKNMLDAVQLSLTLEKQIVQVAEQLFHVAKKTNDAETEEFVQECILKRQTQVIKKIGDTLTTLKKNGEGLGDFLFCKHVLEPCVTKLTLSHMHVTPYVYPRFIKNEFQVPSSVKPCNKW